MTRQDEYTGHYMHQLRVVVEAIGREETCVQLGCTMKLLAHHLDIGPGTMPAADILDEIYTLVRFADLELSAVDLDAVRRIVSVQRRPDVWGEAS